MIKRSYFYNAQAQIDSHAYKSLSGVVTVQSWFSQPVVAFRKVLDMVEDETKIERSKTVITKFERVK